MPLERKTDGERLAMVETHITYLQRGDQDLKDRIDAVEAKVDIVDEKLDMVIARLDASANKLEGASKLAIVIMKSWPIATAAFGAFFIGREF